MPTKSNNFKILQMVTTDFLDYQKAVACLFSKIPYMKIKQIVYNKNTIYKVNFKTSFNEDVLKLTLNVLELDINEVQENKNLLNYCNCQKL